MPNNLDMGGFGSPGLPVKSEIRGSVVVDVANAAGANIMDLRRSGQARYGFGPEGILTISQTGGIKASGIVSLDSTNGYIAFNSNGIMKQYFDGTQVRLASTVTLYWASDNNANIVEFGTVREAAHTLGTRGGTNPQTSRIYGTYTDASNYVRLALAATSTAVTLAAETAGTGADNVPVVITPAGTAQVEVGNGVQFTEMTAPSKPAANKVILFAQDNGAGKTQLMALFPSGAAQQVSIEP